MLAVYYVFVVCETPTTRIYKYCHTLSLHDALPCEGQPYPAVNAALAGGLDAIEAAPAARGWAVALVRYELLLLAELGFGLALDRCTATGATADLAFVSPKSGAAV